MFIQKSKNRVLADTEVAPEATDLLFETSDVAELLAEVTGEEVEATADETGDAVTFSIGEDAYTVEAEGDEEVLEASTKVLRNKKTVAASTKASKSRVIRRVPKK